MAGPTGAANGLAETRTVEEAFRAAARSARSLLDADAAEFLVEDDGQLVVVASHPPGAERSSSPLLAGLVGAAYSGGSARPVDDRQPTLVAAETDGEVARSRCWVPIADHGLLVATAADPGRFTEADRALAARLGGWREAALDRVHRTAASDPAGIARTDGGDSIDRLEEVADILSHDVRNHLNLAAGYLSLARERGNDEHFDRAEAALDRIEQLAEEVVFLARTGERVDETAVVDLADVAHGAWATIPTEDATLEVVDSVAYHANRRALRHLLENVLQNAVVHGGPSVHVRVGAFDEGFYVEDDGPGIPPDQRAQVFESGFRTGAGGSGLGLTIANRLAEAHDWRMRATEGTEGGARIEVIGPTAA